MKEKKVYNPIGLLPPYFKYIGWGIMGVLVVLYFTFFSSWSDFKSHEVVKIIFETILLIALLIVTTSRERIEDERILDIRIKAAASVAVMAVVFPVSVRIIKLILINENLDLEISGFWLVVAMFYWYFHNFWILKRKL